MKNLKFRHTTVNAQDFLFSMKEDNEESYLVAYSLVRKLLVEMAKRARVFLSNKNKYDFADYPFTYRERQLESILLPGLSTLCNGYVFAEYPVIRNSKKYETENSKGRIDYWCIYKNYSFAIELKHSYDNYSSAITKNETLRRWKIMNHYQLKSIGKYLMTFDEKTKGIIPLALHFITSESSEYPTKQERIEYISQERKMLLRIHNKLKRITEPDFISLWEIDKDMYNDYQFNGYSCPGLILVSKFYNIIHHEGSKRYGK